MKYSIIIPCYNEAENLEELIDKITPLAESYDLEFILVENGSVDESRNIFETSCKMQQNWIKKIYIEENQGYGYGIQQGILAASGEYIGWIHADMQIRPENLRIFLEHPSLKTEQSKNDKAYFFKGKRKNRSVLDRFFTVGMSVFETILFQCPLYDIGGIPVLFHRSLLEYCDNLPNNFSIEMYMYMTAIKNGFQIFRRSVILEEREKGSSSWNTGLKSKIKQSKLVIADAFKIKRGEKVL